MPSELVTRVNDLPRVAGFRDGVLSGAEFVGDRGNRHRL